MLEILYNLLQIIRNWLEVETGLHQKYPDKV